VKPIIEIHTSAALTPGDTPAAVGIRPKTIHGWRPISVKIQPNELANSGMNGTVMAAPVPASAAALRLPLRMPTTSPDRDAPNMPMPIMNRNVQ
jgi:hypothetical protein